MEDVDSDCSDDDCEDYIDEDITKTLPGEGNDVDEVSERWKHVFFSHAWCDITEVNVLIFYQESAVGTNAPPGVS